MNRLRLSLILILAVWAGMAQAEAPLRFSEYLTAVEGSSPDYAAQKENVTAAQAGIDIAGVRPDPVLSVGTSREQAPESKPTATKPNTVGITQTIETAGKRGHRIKAAEADLRLAQRSLEGFRHMLAADALDAFVAVIQAREALKRQEASYAALQEVVAANEKRLQAGAIGRLELAQSILEAQRYSKDVEGARADLIAAQARLSVPLGQAFTERFPEREPAAELAELPDLPSLPELLARAEQKRDDILIAKAALESAQAKRDLTKANRWVDVDVGVSVTNTPAVSDVSERSRVLGLSLSMPIPFSRLQRGELVQAEAAQTQAQLGLRSAQAKARAEIESATAQYRSAATVLRNYRRTILSENKRVLEGFRTSYQKGAASLLELLNAQRTADDTYLAYLDALATYARAKGLLQISIGENPDLEGGL